MQKRERECVCVCVYSEELMGGGGHVAHFGEEKKGGRVQKGDQLEGTSVMGRHTNMHPQTERGWGGVAEVTCFKIGKRGELLWTR
jgi:hypothetical protein